MSYNSALAHGNVIGLIDSWNRKRTNADGNYSLLDEQSERRWKKNVGVDEKERQRHDEKK